LAAAIAASFTVAKETKGMLKSDKDIIDSKLANGLVRGKDVDAFGNCLYDAFLEATAANDIELYDELGNHPGVYTSSTNAGLTAVVALRNQAMDVVETHPEEFVAYYNQDQHKDQVATFDDYVLLARFDGMVWGCELALNALAQAFGVTIHVYNSVPEAPME